ncbi:MAG TPA: glycosyltransferase family 1 protein [Candidatus Acidoferrales bacterium]|nr:glycosyltransferase family 1 protein [Candidatus Acidoferrales bacterium]
MQSGKGRPTTVLINALSAQQGGGQTYITNLLGNLPAALPFSIQVLAPDDLELPGDDPRIRKIHLKWPTGNPFARAAWEKFHLPPLLSRLGADVLFCPGGIISNRVPRGCRTVTMFRNMIPFSEMHTRKYRFGYMRLRNRLLKRMFLQSMLAADLVIFLSDHARKTIESHIGTRLKNSVTIPHGLAPAFERSAASNRAAVLADLPRHGYLLYVSTLDFYKAQIEVVRAYALLRARRATKEKLVLVGPEYPEYGRLLRQEIAQLGLQDCVVLTGPVPHSHMPDVYRNALVNIFASQCENCPNILIEALASGRPVLASHCPPMPEFAGDAAVYFDPRSPGDLAGKLAAILDDPSRMQQLSASAEKRSRLYDGKASAHRTWLSIQELARS